MMSAFNDSHCHFRDTLRGKWEICVKVVLSEPLSVLICSDGLLFMHWSEKGYLWQFGRAFLKVLIENLHMILWQGAYVHRTGRSRRLHKVASWFWFGCAVRIRNYKKHVFVFTLSTWLALARFSCLCRISHRGHSVSQVCIRLPWKSLWTYLA